MHVRHMCRGRLTDTCSATDVDVQWQCHVAAACDSAYTHRGPRTAGHQRRRWLGPCGAVRCGAVQWARAAQANIAHYTFAF